MQLRGHIPIAAPARREAADGAESPFRLVLGFEPRWFHLRCGVDFRERWHTDPVYRRETLLRMRAELRRAFPSTGQWSGDEARDVNTIAGCFGVGVIPAVFGIPLRYYPDRWPHPEPGRELSEVEVERLDADRLLDSAFAAGLFEQLEAVAARSGAIYGDLNWQGVLNNAFHLRGQQIFLDLADRPELAARLFEVIAEVIIRLGRAVQERQRRSGFDIDYMCVSNCTLNMISPPMYERMLLPHDARIARSFGRFGVHTCNWDVTPYLRALRKLPRMGYLDMGLESALSRAREIFPEVRRAVLYPPVRLAAVPRREIEADLRHIAEELAPCDVILADIPWDTPEAAVNWFVEACRELEKPA